MWSIDCIRPAQGDRIKGKYIVVTATAALEFNGKSANCAGLLVQQGALSCSVDLRRGMQLLGDTRFAQGVACAFCYRVSR